MKRVPVNSSNLRSVGYNSSSRVLEIEFHSGGIYQYFDVPESIYEGLMAAESHGKYFHNCIKDKYLYKRIN